MGGSPAAQRGQRQALLTIAAGIFASASGLMAALVHQHSGSKRPVLAGVHWLEPQHSGQVVLGSGCMMRVGLRQG